MSIEADKAFTGALPGNFSFEAAKIEITDKRTKKQLVLSSDEVYFDGQSQRIFLQKLEGPKSQQAIYDFGTERLSYY